MTFTIDGVSLLPYVSENGIQWQRSDQDGPAAGRTLDGIMHRMRVATKIRLDITCKPLTTAEASVVLRAILPEYVTVTYDDPMEGTVVTRTMYSNNNPATCQRDGLWGGITFPLVER